MKVLIKFQKIPNAVFDLEDYYYPQTTWDDLSKEQQEEILDEVCKSMYVIVEDVEQIEE